MKDLWKIHGQYYDLSPYVDEHPGGAHMILLGKGQDCTELFESVHSLAGPNVRRMLAKYHVDVEESEPYKDLFEWKATSFYGELSKRVRKYFSTNRLSSKATAGFWMWVTPTILLWLVTFCAWLATANIALGCASGFLGMALGFSVFHAASHSALSEKPWINKLWSHLWGDFHLFCYPLWMQHHVVAHHCYTGIHRRDPDIGNAIVFVRKHPKSRWKPIHRYQHISSLPVMILLPGQWLGQGLQYLAGFFTKRLFGMRVKPFITAKDLCYSLPIMGLSFFLHIALPFYLHGIYFAASLVAYATTFSLLYWAIVFPNHDTLESHNANSASGELPSDWGIQQVNASLSFYQPRWLSQFYGGMNYQIEHHLFPGISPCHFEAISAIVKDCCQDFNVTYTYLDSWSRTFASYMTHLAGLRSNPADGEATTRAKVNV